jgi:hypothetical protein
LEKHSLTQYRAYNCIISGGHLRMLQSYQKCAHPNARIRRCSCTGLLHQSSYGCIPCFAPNCPQYSVRNIRKPAKGHTVGGYKETEDPKQVSSNQGSNLRPLVGPSRTAGKGWWTQAEDRLSN